VDTIMVAGVSHHTATLGDLERVAMNHDDQRRTRRRALALGCTEALVVSTCSRTELLVAVDPAPTAGAPDGLSAALVSLLVGRGEGAGDLVYVHTGEAALAHVFRVAAGLESRVAGELEIQQQLRSASRNAVAAHGEPHRLRSLVSAALAAARGQQGDDHQGRSRRGLLANRAVARGLAGARPRSTLEVVVLGSGTMGRQVVAALPDRGVRRSILGRTPGTAAAGTEVRPLSELPLWLAAADVVFVATSAGHALVGTDLVRTAMGGRADRRLVLVDLSVPRNVAAAVAGIPDVMLLDLDDLGDVADGATALTGAELHAVEEATSTAVAAYLAELRSRAAGPAIRALREHLREVCLHQLRRTAHGGLLDDETLDRMASAVAGAVAHGPTTLLRGAAALGDDAALCQVARAFRIELGTLSRVAPASPPS
jgi:glutamyl-tRNA reductase